MSILINLILGSAFLVLIALIEFVTIQDGKSKIPSFITNLYMILAFLTLGIGGVYVAALAVLIALFLRDFDLWHSWADFKVYIATSFLMGAVPYMLNFTLLFIILNILYKTIGIKFFPKIFNNFPFIIVLFWAFEISILTIAIT